MTTSNWEHDLADLLRELSAVQDELLHLLIEKRDRMAAGDIAGMTALQSREEQVGRRLQGCHDRRRQLLNQAAEQGLPSDSIGKLAQALPAEQRNPLSRQVRHTSQRMRLLQHQSLTNWVLAQRTLLHLSQMLEILATGGQIQPTYGKEKSVTARGALVDREA